MNLNILFQLTFIFIYMILLLKFLFLEYQIDGDGTSLVLNPSAFDSISAFVCWYSPLLPWLRTYILPNILFLLRVDFLNRLTIVNLRLCERFKSLDELPISLKAMDANNTISLEWIIAGSNWKLSKQLECFGSSKLLQKNPTGNPRKNLIKVSLSLSLSKFD